MEMLCCAITTLHGWLYKFNVKNLGTTLKMEYNQMALQDGEEGQEALQEQNQTLLQLFCGDLDMI
jgi:hypothetical protein